MDQLQDMTNTYDFNHLLCITVQPAKPATQERLFLLTASPTIREPWDQGVGDAAFKALAAINKPLAQNTL